MTKGIIFDMDGLMLDTERVSLLTWKQAAAQLGREMPDEVYRMMIGTNAQTVRRIALRELGGDYPLEQIHILRRRLADELYRREGVPVKPGLVPLLKWLCGQNIPHAVATSTARGIALERLKGAGIHQYFDTFVFGDEVEKSKPEPDIFLLAARRMGIAPGHCAVLEDSFAGVTGAHRAGMLALMVPDLLTPTDEIRRLAHRVFPSLEQAQPFLMQWVGQDASPVQP